MPKDYKKPYKNKQTLEDIETPKGYLDVYIESNTIVISFYDRVDPINSIVMSYSAMYQRDWVKSYRLIQNFKKYLTEGE